MTFPSTRVIPLYPELEMKEMSCFTLQGSPAAGWTDPTAQWWYQGPGSPCPSAHGTCHVKGSSLRPGWPPLALGSMCYSVLTQQESESEKESVSPTMAYVSLCSDCLGHSHELLSVKWRWPETQRALVCFLSNQVTPVGLELGWLQTHEDPLRKGGKNMNAGKAANDNVCHKCHDRGLSQRTKRWHIESSEHVPPHDRRSLL